ncbi:MFS transporter [Emcibacteraceae bacterium]|nr:MFS transporter [Emcibacteraceae bacterium]
MICIFKPAKHIDPVDDDEVDPNYNKLRLQVFLGIFIGYAGYYLVRKNFSLAIPSLVEEGFSRTELGFALSGVAIAYGLSKFIMGSVSDRSNARVFMSFGLMASALCMIFMGTSAIALSSVWIMSTLDNVNFKRGLFWLEYI